jgi:hypothetical protein
MTLAQEAQLYLAVVDLFRREGCEPHWRRETPLERAALSKSSPGAVKQDPERRK